MLWKIDNSATRIGGSIHVLAATDYPLPYPFEKSFREAKRIVFESDIRDPRLPSAGLDDPNPLSQRDPELANAAFATLSSFGIDPRTFNTAADWKIAVTINIAHALKLGLSIELGLESHYRPRAEQDRKKLSYLEGPLDALSCFEQAPENEIHEMLRLAIGEPKKGIEQLKRIICGWRQCDIHDLDILVLELENQFPGLYGSLLRERNAAWLPSIKAAAESGEETFILVGALHCVGPGAIPKLLIEEGLSVTRIVY